MRYLIDTSIDPHWNLAAEEYLFMNSTEPIFRLWQNDNAVIVGRYQNTIAEINTKYIEENNIAVVRRLTGGGAVFHDMGNINFTFIDKKIEGEDSAMMFARFTRPIIEALKSLGVEAYLEGRNDLLIDGMKFSGNAIATYRDRILQHGTLLFSSSLKDISGALAQRAEKYIDRSVKSNPRRVTNIESHLKDKMSVEEFIKYLVSYVGRASENVQLSQYTQTEIAAIDQLADTKYRTREWNFGKSPDYQFESGHKFPCGLIEIKMNIENGAIRQVRIFGDYFFLKPTEEIEQRLTGIPHDKQSIRQALCDISLKEYFGIDNNQDFIEALF